MSSIVISGDTSGAITLAAPAVAGTNTATLPAAAGTVMVSGNMPAFSAYASTSQSLTSGVDTKVLFDTETFDTNNNFSSSRFTPTVAGYYQLNTTIRFNGTVPTSYIIYFYKNGSSLGVAFDIITGVGNALIQTISTLVYLNGSTDYMEIYANLTATSPTLGASNANTNYFSGSLVRAA
jgi:hypothetical protein